MIICEVCEQMKSTSEFYFRKDSGKFRKECKECFSIKHKKYRAENSEKVSQRKKKYYENNKQKILLKNKAMYQKNKKKRTLAIEKWRANNPEKVKSYKRKWEKNNIQKVYDRKNKKRKNNIELRLRRNASKAIWQCLKNNGSSKNGHSILDFLPYSFAELKSHLEAQFEPWMNWDNWGAYDLETWDDDDSSTWTWQIDHIIPHSEFKYKSMADIAFKECWSLSNLRPLSSKENLEKGSKLTQV